MKKIIIGLVLITSFGACKKIQDGFQSDQIRYKDNNIYAKRGLTLVQSDRINADGSTPPYTFKLKNLRNLDGSAAPAEFTSLYDVTVFKDGQSFDPATDVSAELLNAKREVKQMYPFYFNENSGQLTFNKASIHLPLGQYLFDVEMTNKTRTKLFPSIGTINVVEPSPEDLFKKTDGVANAFDVAGNATAMRDPIFTCTRISGEGARLILTMVDKNGKAFNPSADEIIQRGDRPVVEKYANFHPVIKNDTAMIIDFELAPFPLKKYIDPISLQDWGFLMYYRIPSKFATIDGFSGDYSVNPRWSWQILLEGTYVLKIKFPDVTHK